MGRTAYLLKESSELVALEPATSAVRYHAGFAEAPFVPKLVPGFDVLLVGLVGSGGLSSTIDLFHLRRRPSTAACSASSASPPGPTQSAPN